jgi:hypothetical protein
MKDILIALAIVGFGVYAYKSYKEAQRQKINLKK